MSQLSEKDITLLRILQHEQALRKCDVRALIAGGANPAVTDPTSGLKPIHIAARLGDLNILKVLLEDERVFADSVDTRGKVPYEWAEEFRKTQAEMFLVNTIIENPQRYTERSIKDARHHLALKLQHV
jgi:hypothetical protein